MHDSMQYDPIQGKVKVTRPWKLEIWPFSTAISPIVDRLNCHSLFASVVAVQHMSVIWWTCVQDMENSIRNTLDQIYFGKTKDVVNSLRSVIPATEQKQRETLLNDLSSALKNRQLPKADWPCPTNWPQAQLIDFGLLHVNDSCLLTCSTYSTAFRIHSDTTHSSTVSTSKARVWF